MIGICSNPSCAQPHNRSKTGLCPKCASAKYREDPVKRKRHREQVKAYTARNPDKRKHWVDTYRERSGYHVPLDVIELRFAVRRLEAALASAEDGRRVRGAGERGGNVSSKRRDQSRRRAQLRERGPGGEPTRERAGEQGPVQPRKA